MSFVIVSATNVLYGPTALSTEDAVLHEQLAGSVSQSNSLTISRRHRHRRESREHNKYDKYDKVMRKYEAKLAECKERNNEGKADKIREKIDYLVQREKERIAVNEDVKVNFDPNGKSIVFKVEDAPARVLNKLAALGYSVLPSAAGGNTAVWTLFKPNYQPIPIYPKLNISSTD